MKQPTSIRPAEGKLGILLPGMGAVATTTMAGVFLSRKGKGLPVGSLTQMGTIRLGRRTDKRVPMIKDFVPLAGLDQLEFGGWDIFPDNAYEAADHAKVQQPAQLPGQPAWREHAKFRQQVAPADARDIHSWILQCVQQGSVVCGREVDALEGLLTDNARPDDPTKGTHSSGDVVQRREVFQIPAVATQHDLAQVDQALDGLLDRSDVPGRRVIPVFHLAVVLEKRHVVGGPGHRTAPCTRQ